MRVITDLRSSKAKGADVFYLAFNGIPCELSDSSSGLMHHKFAIIDGHTLLNGSFNWSDSAVTRNNENLMVIEDSQLIE